MNSPDLDPSNAEVKDKPIRSSRDIFWLILCWLGVAVMLYVLSSGPFWLLAGKKIILVGTPGFRVGLSVYLPLYRASKGTLFHRPLIMYWHLWAPMVCDTKGDLRVIIDATSD
jgi:hypothetical protein